MERDESRGGTEVETAAPAAQVAALPRLTAVTGPGSGRALAMANSLATVGRHPTNDLVLPDPRVSGVHLELRRIGDRLHVKDAGSTNGTWMGPLPATGVHTLDGRVLGTPRYMAPERIRGKDDLDGRSDLFSLGVVLYEMLTGTCPFAASTPSASLAAVLEAVVDPDPRIEPRVWVELHRALAKRPYERHATARELAEALRAASGETEAGLAECLRQSLPSGDGTADPLAPTQPSLRVGGPSFVHTALRLTPDGARVARRVGLVVLACIALTGIGLLRRNQPSRSVPASPSTLVATSSLTAAPAPSSTAIPLPRPTQPSIPLPSPPPLRSARFVRRARNRSPRRRASRPARGIVVGAGPTGLVLALWLRRAGIDVGLRFR